MAAARDERSLRPWLTAEGEAIGFGGTVRRGPRAPRSSRGSGWKSELQGAESDDRPHCVALELRERHQYCTRHTFITLTHDDGGDGSYLRWITHAPPNTAYDGCLREHWGRLCVELCKLKIVLPTVGDAALNGGGGGGGAAPGAGSEHTLDDILDDAPNALLADTSRALPNDRILRC